MPVIIAAFFKHNLEFLILLFGVFAISSVMPMPVGVTIVVSSSHSLEVLVLLDQLLDLLKVVVPFRRHFFDACLALLKSLLLCYITTLQGDSLMSVLLKLLDAFFLLCLHLHEVIVQGLQRLQALFNNLLAVDDFLL